MSIIITRSLQCDRCFRIDDYSGVGYSGVSSPGTATAVRKAAKAAGWKRGADTKTYPAGRDDICPTCNAEPWDGLADFLKENA